MAEAAGGSAGTAAEAAETAPTPTKSNVLMLSYKNLKKNEKKIIN